ncbi:MAG: GerMN domain-containing protein [Atribacterota bacterium]|nr:GerMN domain-containing protein [Atribacterota bacterium]MDD5637695.1 GerMN domain-containing protein [Atribacterota bacterium]
MARRRKKKNIFKSTLNLIILIFLLVIIFFLVQKFVFPLFQERERIEIEESSREEIEVEPPSVLEEEQVVLYFADDNAQYLVPEYRNIQKTEEMAKQAIIELIKGPTNSNLYPTVPSTTRVNALYISDGIAYIDLSSEIIKNHSGGSTGELLTVYSIVLTLTSFPDINKVQIMVDGNSGETLVGHVDTSIPLERDDSWLRR